MINAIGINNVGINISFIHKVGNPDIDIDHINKFKIKRDFFGQYVLSISFDTSRYDEIESIISDHIYSDIKDITIKYGDYPIYHRCFTQNDRYDIIGYKSSIRKNVAKIKIIIDTFRDDKIES